VPRERRLTVVLLLNLLLVTALVVVGLRAPWVLAADGDYLADATAIAVWLLAIWSSRKPSSPFANRGSLD
jgi:Co/Zn/Cd efflux system component